MTKQFQDQILTKLSTNNDKMVEFMAQIKDAINAINDTNKLHTVSIEKNTNAQMEMIKSNAMVMSFIRWVLVALIIALIVLAGAEKALQFIKL